MARIQTLANDERRMLWQPIYKLKSGLYPRHDSQSEVTAGQPETPTGVFFVRQTAESLVEAVSFFEDHKNLFNPLSIRKHAERFDCLIFKERFKQYIEKLLC